MQLSHLRLLAGSCVVAAGVSLASLNGCSNDAEVGQTPGNAGGSAGTSAASGAAGSGAGGTSAGTSAAGTSAAGTSAAGTSAGGQGHAGQGDAGNGNAGNGNAGNGSAGTSGAGGSLTTCAVAGGTCTAVGACDIGTGFIAEVSDNCGSAEELCCVPSCGGHVEDFTCCQATFEERPSCDGGSLKCPSGTPAAPGQCPFETGGNGGAAGSSGGKQCLPDDPQLTCGADEYCDFSSSVPGTCGHVDNGVLGTCVARPTSCSVIGCPDPDFEPCGCDGKTYCNACEANENGVDVDQSGACHTGNGGSGGSDAGGGGGAPANACEQAGGACVAVTPTACMNGGTLGDSSFVRRGNRRRVLLAAGALSERPSYTGKRGVALPNTPPTGSP